MVASDNPSATRVKVAPTGVVMTAAAL